MAQAQVIGGNTKSGMARVAEVIGWFPILAALVLIGGASFLEANGIMTMPSWAELPVDLYRGVRDYVLNGSIARDVPDGFKDIAVSGVSILTMISRKIVNFFFSMGGFIVLSVVAWFVLGRIGAGA